MKVFLTAMECEAESVVRNLENAVESSVFGRRVVRGTLGGAARAAGSGGDCGHEPSQGGFTRLFFEIARTSNGDEIRQTQKCCIVCI